MISRRQFLRADYSGKTVVIRPPWSINEPAFVDACTRCNDCLAACPEKILSSDSAGFPFVNFAQGECTFCVRCADVCHPGAIDKKGESAPWNWIVAISPQCLAVQNTICRSCGEHCEVEAIHFQLSGGASMPRIDAGLCTGCGACVSVCPIQAIHPVRNMSSAEFSAAAGADC